MAAAIKYGDRVTDGRRKGTVRIVYPQHGEASIMWDGGKRQSIQKIAKLRKLTVR